MKMNQILVNDKYIFNISIFVLIDNNKYCSKINNLFIEIN